MNHLLMSVAFATALTGAALPARADTSPDHAHGAQSAMFTEVSRRVLAAGDYRASVKLLDGRTHFGHLHAGHPGHAGIPTHRLMVDFQAKSRGRSAPTAADLEVVAPTGQVTQTALSTEGGKLLADLELAATGSYGFRLGVKERAGKRILRWSETLK